MPLRLVARSREKGGREAASCAPDARQRILLARSKIVWGQEVSGEAPELEGGQPPTDPQAPMQVPNASSHVFISYASQDVAIANAIVETLERHGVTCWIAPRDVKAGALYADAIVRAISRAKAFVLVLSESAIASSHVSKEIERASSKKRPIIALRIDAAPLTPALEYFLSESQWVEAQAGNIDPAYVKLIDAIREPARAAPESFVAVASGTSAAMVSAVHPKSHRIRIVLAVGFVVVAALAALLADKFWHARRAALGEPTTAATNVVSEKSIAVLPFTDMSEKKDQEYFADGMAEEILDILVKVPSLKVIGRTSSFQFKGQNEDLRTIGTRLGVAYVLEGSVRRSADRVRVTAQLIDARDGTHLWSETYDRPANDALLMQGEIATTLSRSLEIGIGADRPQSERRLKNDAAYDLYLRGRYAAERGDADGMATGVTYLRQALDADPNFADAAVALALTYYNQAFTSLEPSSVFELARQEAESALKLNPRLGLAHAVLGGIHNDYDWEWAAADREFKQALALAPHDGRVLTIAADHAVALGQLDAARQMLKQALAYDPLLADAYSTLLWAEWCSGRYAEMLAAARKVLEIDPTYDWGHTNVGLALIYRGDPAAAITEIKSESNPVEQAWALALAYYALGRAADSNAALTRLIAGGADNYAYEVAEVYAYRGERDEALKWLERAYVQKDGTLKWIARDPSLAKLEFDPRFKAFVRKLNLPEYRRVAP
jgi:TolB-like protein